MKKIDEYIQKKLKAILSENYPIGAQEDLEAPFNEPEEKLVGGLESYKINYDTNTFDCKVNGWKGDDIEISFEIVVEKLYKIIPEFFHNIEKMFPESNDVYGDAVRFLEGQNYNFKEVLESIFKERMEQGLEPNGQEKQDEYEREIDESEELEEAKKKHKKVARQTIRGFFMDLLRQDQDDENDISMDDVEMDAGGLEEIILKEFNPEDSLPEEGEFLIYKTDLIGIEPKHDIVDMAGSKVEAKNKVKTLEIEDPEGIYYFDLKQPLQKKYQLN